MSTPVKHSVGRADVDADKGDGSGWLGSFRVRAVREGHCCPWVLAGDRAITRQTVR